MMMFMIINRVMMDDDYDYQRKVIIMIINIGMMRMNDHNGDNEDDEFKR